MTRKKSPKPTRYIRTRRRLLFDAVFLVALAFFVLRLPAVLVFLVVIFSEPRMQHVEVQFEPFRIVSFEKSLAQIEATLPALSLFTVWTIKSFSNQIANLTG